MKGAGWRTFGSWRGIACVPALLYWGEGTAGSSAAARRAAAMRRTDGKLLTSNLRLGVCTQNAEPYVHMLRNMEDEEVLYGFEIEVWNYVYARMVSIIAHDHDNNSTRMAGLVGNYFPQEAYVKLDSQEDVMLHLDENKIDIGFCALRQTHANQVPAGYDVLNPHIKTGLRLVTTAEVSSFNFIQVMQEIFASLNDPFVGCSLILMVVFAILFGHVIWLFERDPGTNAQFHQKYGPGFVDGFWLCMVTATTVGYGDKCPHSMPGKFVMMSWMFLGCYFSSIFQAAITSKAVERSTAVAAVNLPCQGVDTLDRCRVAFLNADGRNRTLPLVTHSGALNFTMIGNANELLHRLNKSRYGRSAIDVAVLDAWTANYMVAMPEFKGKTQLFRGTFSIASVSLAVSRPGGKEHLLFPLMQRAIFELVHGEDSENFEQLVQKWFGQESGPESSEQKKQLRSSVKQTNIYIALVLSCVFGIWGCAVFFYYLAEIREDLVRKRFMAALSLGRTWTLHQLRLGAVALFKRYDKDGSGSIDLDEMKTLLRTLGKDIKVRDVKKYIEIGRGFQKVDEQKSSLITGSNDPSSRPQESSLPQNAGDGQTRKAEQSEGITRQLYKGMSQIFENDSDDSDLENLTLTQPEFVRVIEGIVLDEDSSDESEDEDMGTVPQKRHVIAVGGDMSAHADILDKKVKKDVDSIQIEMSSVREILDLLIAAMQSSGQMAHGVKFDDEQQEEALKGIQLTVEEKREAAKNVENAGGGVDVPHAPETARTIAKVQPLPDRAEGMSRHGHVAGGRIGREESAGGAHEEAEERGVSPARTEDLDEVLESLEDDTADAAGCNLAHARHEQDSATTERHMFTSLSRSCDGTRDSDLPGATQQR